MKVSVLGDLLVGNLDAEDVLQTVPPERRPTMEEVGEAFAKGYIAKTVRR